MKLARIVWVIGLAALIAFAWRVAASRPAAPAPQPVNSTAKAAPVAPQSPAPGPLVDPVANASASVPEAFVAHVFGARGPVTIGDVPAGRFREQLLQLPPVERERALATLGRLHVPRNDAVALAVDRDGRLYYECARPAADAETETTGSVATAQTVSDTPVSVDAPPIRHSRPGASRVLYLDFNGHTVTGTAWNLANSNRPAVGSYVCRPYNTDGDETKFDDAEQAAIVEIWRRVAEHYSAFDVDVTTEEPAAFTPQTLRALITRTSDANGTMNPSGAISAGVAYLDVFGHADLATYSPVFVYFDVLSGPVSIADVVAHELGHNLALAHDGTTFSPYYSGHGTGPLSWAPIMGAPYGRTVVQWSKGEYYGANNPQDDLAIVADRLTLRTDVAGASRATATDAPVAGNDVSAADTLLGAGESHFHRVVTAAGRIAFGVAPVSGGNADLKLELLDAAGNVVATGDDATQRVASVSTANSVAAGSYYLKVTAAGTGTPLVSPPSGYTAYGSVGQYTLTGSVVALPPVIVSASTASVGVGHFLSYQTQVVGFAASYAATGLPTGLTLDSATGMLTGRPTTTGVYSIALSATNSVGTGQATLTLTVTDAAPAVTVASTPSVVLTPGGSTTLSVTGFSVNGAIGYQWFRDGRAIAGATSATYNVANATERGLAAYWVTLTNTVGTTRSAPFFVRVAPAITSVRAWGTDNYSGQQNVPAGLGRVVDVAAGSSHSLALRADGSVISWGSIKTAPAVSDAVAVVAGYGFSLALRADGTVATTANNDISTTQGIPAVPAGLRDVVAIAAGYYQALALKSDGTVVTWGNDNYGLLTLPSGLTDVVAIAAGGYTSLALKADGTVVGWGGSDSAPPVALAGVKAIASGSGRMLALKSGGTTVAWGSAGVSPGMIDENSLLAIGSLGVFVAAPDGHVSVWGASSSAASPPADLAGVFRLSAGGNHALAVSDGTSDAAPTITGNPASALRAVGASVTLRVTATGPGVFTYQWRKNSVAIAGATAANYTIASAQAEDAGTYDVVVSNHAGSTTSAAATLTVEAPPTISAAPAASIVATPGAPLTLAVTATSANAPLTYQWKKNNRVLTGATSATLTLPSFSAADAGTYVLEITDAHGLRSRVLTFVRADSGPTQVAIWGRSYGLSNPATGLPADAVAIAATEVTALALRADGHVAIWGYGSSTALRTALSSVTRAVGIALRNYTAHHVLRDDGRILTWDTNGNASTEPYADVIALSASMNLSAALLADGTVRVWGDNFSPAVPEGLDNVTAISAGSSHVLALRTDGTVVAFGSNGSGQCNVPVGLTGVVAVAAGAEHSLALKADGAVVAWGNVYGQSINPPADLGPTTAIFAGNSYSLALRADGTARIWTTTDRELTRIPTPATGLLALGGGPSNAAYIRTSTNDVAPAIVRQPAAIATGAGMPQRFSVAATGSGPLRYQWRKDGALLPDQTQAFLDLLDPQPADAGSYDVVVSNHVASVTSAAATLTLVTPPAITAPPPRRFLANAGQNVRLSATASSAFGPLTYQWKKNNRPIAGATAATYEIATFAAADAGAYTLEVTDSRGAVTRATTFVVADVGATQVKLWSDYSSAEPPAGLSEVAAVRAGNGAILRSGDFVAWNYGLFTTTGLPSSTLPFVDAARDPGLSEQSWLALRADGLIVGSAGARRDSLTATIPANLRGVIALARGDYSVFALSSDGRVYSWTSSGYFYALDSGEVPVSAIAAGSNHLVLLRTDGTVFATGGTNSSGELDVPAGLANVTAIAAGASHTLALKADGTVVAWGGNHSYQCDVPANLSGVVAIGAAGTRSYALKADGTLVRWGGGSYSPSTAPAAFGPAIAFAPSASEAIVLRSAAADAAPTIITQPAGPDRFSAGDALTLRVAAAGSGSLAYQWRKDGVPLARGTSAIFTVDSLQTSDSGRYDVVVSNHVGSVVSNSVVVDVAIPPTLTSSASARQLVTLGSPVSVTFNATSDFGPLAFQWKKNNRPIVGATSSTLSIASVTRADAGAYTLEATDTRGIVSRATVFVLPSGPSQVRAWGLNSSGQTNLPGTVAAGALAVAAGNSSSFALLPDGTVVGWGPSGSYSAARVPTGLSGVVDLAAGTNYALALRVDGTVTYWTAHVDRPLPAPARDIVAISAGESVGAALRADGAVVVFSGEGNVLDTFAAVDGPFVAVAAGRYHVLALRLDGTVRAWTASSYSPSPAQVPAGLSNVAAIAAGGNRSLALRSDGSVTAWGDDAGLQAIGSGGATKIAAGTGGAGAVLADGTLGVWSGSNFEILAVPADLGPVHQFSLGYGHGLALVAGGAGSPPTIARAPASLARAPGDFAFFDVVVTGAGPFSYQWRKNGTAVAGANASALMLSPLQSDDAASYDVVVSNAWGSVTSAAATLAVTAGPQVTTAPPARVVAALDSPVTLSATASSEFGPLSYQWKKDNRPIAGATSATLALGNLAASQTGVYTLEIADTRGVVTRVTSFVFAARARTQLRVYGDAGSYAFTTPPVDLGDDAVAVTLASDRVLITRADGTAIVWAPNSNNPSWRAAYPFPDITDVVATAYTDSRHFALRADGTVSVWGFNITTPTTVANLRDVVAIASCGSTMLALRSNGTLAEWGTNGNYTTFNATSATGQFKAVGATLRDVTSLATNGYTSSVAAVRLDGTVVAWSNAIYSIPTFVAGASSARNVARMALNSYAAIALRDNGALTTWSAPSWDSLGSPPTLTDVIAIAAGSAHAVALRANGAVAAWGANSYGATALPSGPIGAFAVAALDNRSLVLRDTTGDAAPTIVAPPASQAAILGSNATFSVTASGPEPYLYQWRKNGLPISGATAATLVIPAVSPVDAAQYDVVVSNHAGSTASAAATLAVNSPPTFATSPNPRQVVPLGSSLTLTHTLADPASGNVVQWYFNNRLIAGANSLSYTIPAVTDQTAGAYTLAVTSAAGLTVRLTTFVRPAGGLTRVRAWGKNDYGQITPPAGLGDAVAISAGDNHALALRADGTVVAWGDNRSGQCNVPATLRDVVAVAAGNLHSLALRADGTVVAWGYNSFSVPTGWRDVVAVDASGSRSVALRSDGTVVVWGDYSSTVPPASATGIVAVAAGSNHIVALKSDGTVVAWPYGYAGGSEAIVPADLADIVAISASYGQSAAITRTGGLVVWGSSAGSVALGATPLALVECGPGYGLARQTDDTWLTWGDNTNGTRNVPADLAGFRAVSAGGTFAVALCDATGDAAPTISAQPQDIVAAPGSRAGFTVTATGPGLLGYQWRFNGTPIAGATAAKLTLADIGSAQAGGYDVVVSNHAGSVTSRLATLALGTPPTFISAPPARTLVAPGQALTLAGAATTDHGPLAYRWKKNNRPIPGATAATFALASFTAADAGAYTLEAIDARGLISRTTTFVLPDYGSTEVVAFGGGTGDYYRSLVTVPANLGPIVSVVAGQQYSAALRRDGTVAMWGMNCDAMGRLPTDLRDVVALAAGYDHVLALHSDGTVVAWGRNYYGGAAVPAGLRDVIAIAAGGENSLAVRSDGSIVVWGFAGSGVTQVPATLGDVSIAAVKDDVAIVVQTDGTVVAWGSAASDRFKVPANLAGIEKLVLGGNHALALRTDGTLATWGAETASGLAAPAGTYQQIGASYSRSGAIQADGGLNIWGNNDYGQRNAPAGVGDYVDLALGYYHTIALRMAAADALPVITTHPGSRAVARGSTVTLTVAATSTRPLSYQWRRNGTAISGATTATLTITNAQDTAAGNYDVVVANPAGSVTSSAAVIAIDTPPTITSAPDARQPIALGASRTLTFSASTTHAPLSYRWKKNNRVLAGATTASLTLTNFTAADAGAYTLEITDALGLVTRATTFVLPDYGRTQVRAWGDGSGNRLAVPTDLSDTIALTATGFHTFALRAGGTIAVWGSDSGTLKQIPAGLTDVVALSANSSDAIALKKDGTLVGWGSSDMTPLNGLRDVIAVSVGNNLRLALKSDGTVASWPLTSSAYYYTPSPTDLADVVAIAAGDVHGLALKADGTVVGWGTNSAATVPAGLAGVVAISAADGSSAALKNDGTVVVWGNIVSNATPSLRAFSFGSGGSYALGQRLDGTLVGLGSSNSVANVVPADLGAVLGFSAGASHAVVLRDARSDTAPVLTAEPHSVTLNLGAPHTFAVSAIGSGPLAYQWFKDGTAIAGATAATFTIGGVTTADLGSYTVKVFNHIGSRVSGPASLTLFAAPQFTARPARRIGATLGQSVTLAATVVPASAEAGSLRYQWKKNNRPIAGATAATLTIPSFAFADAGAYTLEVTDALGSVARHTSFVLPQGAPTEIRTWGSSASTPPSDLTDAVKIAITRAFVGGVALRADGHVVAWGNNAVRPPVGLDRVVDLAVGYNGLTIALRDDQTVVTYGSNGLVSPPAGMTDVVAVAAGNQHFLALGADGRVRAWSTSSYNSYGQVTVPAGLKDVVAIAAAGDTNVALTSTGDVVVWGFRGGRLPPIDSRDLVEIALGSGHLLARTTNGTVLAGVTDYAYSGETAIPSDLGSIAMIAAGSATSFAVKADGTVRAWGSNNYGLQTLPTALTNVVGLAVAENAAAALRVTANDVAPAIVTPPASRNLAVGTRLELSVVATGTGPLSYQWRHDGVAISGATASTFAVANAGLGDAGVYDVVVSNRRGSATSAAVTVTVATGPVVATAPSPRVVVASGQSVTLNVSASGSIGYQWKKNNRAIPGATSASYSIGAATLIDSGAYTVEVSDSAGRVTRCTSFVAVSPNSTQFVAFGDGNYSYNLTQLPATVTGPLLAVAAGGSHNLVLKADGTVAGWGSTGDGASTPPAGLSGVIAISAGDGYSLALKSDGTVAAWGYNYYGPTAVPSGLSSVVAISAGRYHALALKSDGTVVTWGNSSNTNLAVPAGLSDVVSVFAGYDYSLAVKADGSLVVWGSPQYNQATGALGQTSMVKAVGGYYAVLALKTGGSVAAWGNNGYGHLNVPSSLTGVVDLAISYYHALALKSDGTVVSWGSDASGSVAVPSGLNNAFAIAIGDRRSLVLRDASADAAPTISAPPQSLNVVEGSSANLTVTATGSGPLTYQWRRNGVALSGATSTTLTLGAVTSAQAGTYDVVVTNHVGTVTSAAASLTVHPLPVVTAQNLRRVVTTPGGSAQFTVSATGTGTLTYQWRRNGRAIAGATSPTLALSNLTRADNGWYVCAITDANGTRLAPPQWVLVAPAHTQTLAWGANTNHQTEVPVGLADAIAVAAGGSHSLALRRDGAIAGWGNSNAVPPSSATLAGVVAVAADSGSSYTLHSDGTLRRWGGYYQIAFPNGAPFVAISSSGDSSVALRADGSAITWNYYSSSATFAPTDPANLSAVAAASSFFVGLKVDGTLVQWGSAPTLPTGLTDVMAISAGSSHALALKSDGTVVAWGGNSSGQCDVPAGLAGVVAISASNNASFALKSDGTLVTWGSNASGERNVPADATSLFALAAAGAANHLLALRDTAADGAPTLSTAPASLVAATGERAVLRVVAAGVGPFSYVWRKNGAIVAGATTATLAFDPVSASDAGSYTVEVANHIGSVVSALAVVTVENAPTFTQRPAMRLVGTPGATLTLTGSATSDYLPIAYQWNKNNRPLAGATSATLALANFTNADAGAYTLVATDAHGHKVYATSFVLPNYGSVQLRSSDTYWVPPTVLGAVVDFAANNVGGVVVRADGTVAGWGPDSSATIPASVANAVRVVSANGHALALLADGTVIGWGYNDGSGSISVPGRATNVVAIATGYTHSLALRADGSVVAWGANDKRQCDVPADLTGVVAIGAHGYLSAALKADGTVAVWGDTTNGATTVPAGLSGVTSIAVGYAHVLALKSDGTVVAWGGTSNNSGQVTVPAGLSGIVEIAAGGTTSYARSASSVISVWGSGSSNNNPSGLGTIYAVRGDSYTMLLLRDSSNDTAPTVTTNPTSTTVASGTYSVSFSVVAAGSGPLTYQWRHNGTPLSGQTGASLYLNYVGEANAGNYDVVVTNHIGSVTSNAATLTVTTGGSNGNGPVIAAPASNRLTATIGQPVTLTLSATGTGTLAYQWFHDNRPISGATSPTLSLASFSRADAGAYTLAVTDPANNTSRRTVFVLPSAGDTFVLGAGNDSFGQTTPPDSLTDALAIATGDTHSLALRADGTVTAWGNNVQSQSAVPANLTSIVAVAAGSYSSFALKSDGTAVSWGSWSSNVNGNSNNRNLIALAAGYNISAGLRDDGSVVSWTSNYYTAPTLSNAVAVAAGADHAVALKLDGTVAAWGDNSVGQTNVPAGLSGVTAIAAGYRHTLALKSDGTVVAWGRDHVGQTTVPATAQKFVAIAAAADWSAAQTEGGTWLTWGATTPTGPGLIMNLGTPLAQSWGARHTLFLFAAANLQLPIITAHPQSENVAAGANLTLSVTATGPGTLTYQWLRDGTPLADGPNRTGTQTATLSLSHFSATDAGHYTVAVTNSHGTATSLVSVVAYQTTPQTIDFPALAGCAYTTTPIVLNATASSGLPVDYTIVSGPATLSGSQLTLTGTGTVVVLATQAGDASYAPAAPVERSFAVSNAVANLVLSNLNRTYDGAPKPVSAATSPANLAIKVSYEGRPDAPATPGTYSVFATIADSRYSGTATGTLTIARGTQTIDFAGPGNQALSSTPVVLSASATSGLPVTFTVVSGPASLDGNALTLLGNGTITLRASQPGDENYLAASDVDRTFVVGTTFDGWRLSYFTADELLDTALAGPNADPDHDGFVNLTEYALGTDPRANSAASAPQMSTSAGNWTFTYTRPADRPDIAYTVEYSTNLTTWNAAGVTHTLVSSANGVETWRATYPTSSTPSCFFRLVVMR